MIAAMARSDANSETDKNPVFSTVSAPLSKQAEKDRIGRRG
jgi:hypothetical protein